jgi:hypothetical protein
VNEVRIYHDEAGYWPSLWRGNEHLEQGIDPRLKKGMKKEAALSWARGQGPIIWTGGK